MTDRNPLKSYLNYNGLKEEENRRMINLKRKSEIYHFNTVYGNGDKNEVADHFSQMPRDLASLDKPEGDIE